MERRPDGWGGFWMELVNGSEYDRSTSGNSQRSNKNAIFLKGKLPAILINKSTVRGNVIWARGFTFKIHSGVNIIY